MVGFLRMRIVHILEAIVKFKWWGGWDVGHSNGCWAVPISVVFSMLDAKVPVLVDESYRQECDSSATIPQYMPARTGQTPFRVWMTMPLWPAKGLQ